jgi:oligoribonuclease NrnB/cAMP/cGMP phosphodiesterase (DHH superfamily)
MMKRTLLPLRLHVQAHRDDPQPLVLYHGKGCSDGFGAALAAWLFYKGQVECIGLDHGQVQSLADLPSVVGRCVYILDFSLPAEVLRAIDESAQRLVLLDHHQSAADKLAGFVCRCGAVHFDMGKSGARLAWEFFFPDQEAPPLVAMVEDRDLWLWHLPQSAAFLSALDMEKQDFARWAEVARLDGAALTAYIARGQAMDDKFQALAREIAASARPIDFDGEQGLMVNAPSAFHSLVGNLLSERSGTFALVWTVTDKGEVKGGLRAVRSYNVIPLAERMGGGGHPQACGFRMSVSRLPELLSGVFTSSAPSQIRP